MSLLSLELYKIVLTEHKEEHSLQSDVPSDEEDEQKDEGVTSQHTLQPGLTPVYLIRTIVEAN
jgi:hypothetical protein